MGWNVQFIFSCSNFNQNPENHFCHGYNNDFTTITNVFYNNNSNNWAFFSLDSNSAHRISSTWTHQAKNPVRSSKSRQLRDPTLHRKWNRADQLVRNMPTAAAAAVPPCPSMDRGPNLRPSSRGNASAKAQTRRALIVFCLVFFKKFPFQSVVIFFVADKCKQCFL